MQCIWTFEGSSGDTERNERGTSENVRVRLILNLGCTWRSLHMDFLEALTYGAIISATDPIAVLSIFHVREDRMICKERKGREETVLRRGRRERRERRERRGRERREGERERGREGEESVRRA